MPEPKHGGADPKENSGAAAPSPPPAEPSPTKVYRARNYAGLDHSGFERQQEWNNRNIPGIQRSWLKTIFGRRPAVDSPEAAKLHPCLRQALVVKKCLSEKDDQFDYCRGHMNTLEACLRYYNL